ncbi:TerD family protein [Streptomyces sp. NPDC005017]|uniref:TerD family protein n=1 Tax=Streptomyces sp. NPDC005017 TaxID=3364706 RepID=UPI0036A7FFFA
MSHITKGANTPVPAAPLRVAVGRAAVAGTPDVNASALLLDAEGRVRGEADLVLRGRPAHPSGAVRHGGVGQGGGQSAEWLELDLPSIEPDVRRVVIAGSCADGTFGQVPGLYVQAITADLTIVTHYEVTDASTETAFVLGEFYRREGGWRFRAVGQGYDSGLTGLAADFGAAPGAAVSSGPVPLTGVSKTGSAPSGAATPVGTPPPIRADTPGPTGPVPPHGAGQPDRVPAGASASPVPAASPVSAPAAPFTWGKDFKPFVRRGKGEETFTVRAGLSEGPVIVEGQGTEGGWFEVQAVEQDRFGPDTILDVYDRQAFHGRALFHPRPDRPLRLKVRHEGKWTVSIRPLSAALPLGTGATVTGRGPEVFAYTGPSADLDVRLDLADGKQIWFELECHEARLLGDRDSAERLVDKHTGPFERTLAVPDGPLLLFVRKGDGDWRLTTRPLPVRDPEEMRRTGHYEGRGGKELPLFNPRPGRPALVRYEFTDVDDQYAIRVTDVDEVTDLLTGGSNGVGGTAVLFGSGQDRQNLRIRHKGGWSLRLLPEEEAPLFTGPVEGRGSTVLRYQGPPTLMSVRQTSSPSDWNMTVRAYNHPQGKSAVVAGTWGADRPVLGPVWVDPGGTCFLIVRAQDDTTWRLEPAPFDAAPVLGERTEGHGYGVVRHTGPETEMRFAPSGDPESRPLMHIFALDENLFPAHKVGSSFGRHHVPGTFLQVRSDGRWAVEGPGRRE